MSDFTCEIHDESMVAALARLKQIPVSKVIRNAGRDFAFAAQKETPLASVSRSEYYRYFDQRDRQWHYLHESQVKDRGFAGGTLFSMLDDAGAVSYQWKPGKLRKDGTRARPKVVARKKLYRVRVHKGWSKASWIGVFRQLGLPPKPRGRLSEEVEGLSQVTQTATDYYSEMTIDDAIHFDRFGRDYSPAMVEKIAKAGYEAAAKNITKETQRMLEKQWKGEK